MKLPAELSEVVRRLDELEDIVPWSYPSCRAAILAVRLELERAFDGYIMLPEDAYTPPPLTRCQSTRTEEP